MPSARPAVKLTYAEYCTLPEGARYQLIGGDLIVSPSPTRRHQAIVKRIAFAVDGFVAARKLGDVYFSPLDVILSDRDVIQPDILFVSASRSTILVPEGARGGPDLCVEVLSASTKAVDRGAKQRLYALHGVTEYWIADPDGGTVEIYRLQDDAKKPAATYREPETLTTKLLTGFSLSLADVFAP